MLRAHAVICTDHVQQTWYINYVVAANMSEAEGVAASALVDCTGFAVLDSDTIDMMSRYVREQDEVLQKAKQEVRA